VEVDPGTQNQSDRKQSVVRVFSFQVGLENAVYIELLLD